jgi:acetoin utilization deacetylase AcuC-like enzyme
MKAFYSDTFVLPLPEHHRFPMNKYRLLRQRIVSEGIVREEDLSVPDAIAWESLRLVHDAEYVEQVARGALPPEAQRRIGFPWSPMMVERSRRSVGATLAAAREALNGARRLPAFAGLDIEPAAARRQPGVSANLAGGTHHAFRDRGEGYCVFNDVAVAATVLRRERAVARVAVVDCDVHQGNGTAAIFKDDPAVFTFSMHGARNFPFRKETSDLDLTFEDGAGDDEYLAALGEHLPRVLDGHRPDLVFYLAGADPYEGDRLGRLKLTIGGLQARDRLVFDACGERRLPVAVAMSGGYATDVDAIVSIHANTVAEAVRVERSFRVDPLPPADRDRRQGRPVDGRLDRDDGVGTAALFERPGGAASAPDDRDRRGCIFRHHAGPRSWRRA